METDYTEAIKGLAARYPERWKRATANSNLRGWFVGQVQRSCGAQSAVDRFLIRREIDRAMTAGQCATEQEK
jgi:hypothetical protein